MEMRTTTVGPPIPHTEVKIVSPDTGRTVPVGVQGELCCRGPNVMGGYWNLPDRTAEVFDSEGYFLTGDIAEIDDDGFIRITDRKKDLIVTAGGKNVAPQPIENEIKRSPLVDNAVLIGDRRPFISALISPNEEELPKWAAQRGLGDLGLEDLTRHPELRAEYAALINTTNEGLARYEQIKKFEVLPLMLSIDGGHLTPTLKVKRRVVEKDYADLIESIYAD